MSYLGKDIKKLGFGLMRLPQKGDQIDIEQGKELKVHNNLKYKKFKHNQESIIPPF